MSWLKPASKDSGSAASSVSSAWLPRYAGDALRAGDHVAVRQHHALRPAGAAGGVEDRRHVGVDDAVARRDRRGEQFLPCRHRQLRRAGGGCRARRAGIDEHDVAQVGTRPERPAELRQPLGRGHEHAHVAVAQDVADLVGLQQRIERHEDAARRRRAEAGDHGLEALFQVDRDALAAPQAERAQSGSTARDGGLQIGIGDRRGAVRQRHGIGRRVGGTADQFVEQDGFGHGKEGECSSRRVGRVSARDARLADGRPDPRSARPQGPAAPRRGAGSRGGLWQLSPRTQARRGPAEAVETAWPGARETSVNYSSRTATGPAGPARRRVSPGPARRREGHGAAVEAPSPPRSRAAPEDDAASPRRWFPRIPRRTLSS